jgi:hypothetical protein
MERFLAFVAAGFLGHVVLLMLRLKKETKKPQENLRLGSVGVFRPTLGAGNMPGYPESGYGDNNLKGTLGLEDLPKSDSIRKRPGLHQNFRQPVSHWPLPV